MSQWQRPIRARPQGAIPFHVAPRCSSWRAIALVLAIPVGAMLATANPIPDPPSRKALNVAPPVKPANRTATNEQAEKEKRRTDKKQREEKNRRADQQPADEGRTQLERRGAT